MLNFQELTLDDKDWIDEILKNCHYMSCEYCFGNHFIWRKSYQEQVARSGDYYTLMLNGDEGETGKSFLFPAGPAAPGDTAGLKQMLEELLAYCEKQGIPLRLHSMPAELLPDMERMFPGLFVMEDNRDYADYIYKTESLAELAGKKYHGKRNHLKRFRENDWSYEPITPDNFSDCLKMNEEWCRINDCGRNESIKEEQCAVRQSFRRFNELNFFGGLLRVEGRVVAYTLAERLNSDTVAVHMEKAFSEIQGAYVAINREFAASLCGDYTYVNREEDLGVEGLRRAKLSWNPAIILPKYSVRLKDPPEKRQG